MAACESISAARARALMRYEPETGVFVRTLRRGKHATGQVVGTLDADGYRITKIDGHPVKLHRLAFLFMTGAWPSGEVDHRDSIRCNNRWANLRLATRAINQQNRRRTSAVRKHGTLLGAKKEGTRWAARISLTGTSHRIGSFATEQAAHAAYVEAKRRLHPGCTL